MDQLIRLGEKLDRMQDTLAAIHTDMEVMKAQRTSGEKMAIDHETRLRALEDEMAAAGRARAWMAGVSAGAGAILGYLANWLFGKGH
jgi:hypothetical protein